jgi:hypothetical protein
MDRLCDSTEFLSARLTISRPKVQSARASRDAGIAKPNFLAPKSSASGRNERKIFLDKPRQPSHDVLAGCLALGAANGFRQCPSVAQGIPGLS